MMPDEKAGGPAARPDTLLGQTLAGRYLLTRKIGEGGMGAVYEATHVGLDKLVAVKILRDKYLDRPAVAQRLVKEAKLASAIRNEHIIDITDSGATDDGRTFVVMELLEGESLAELLRREGAIPEARAFAIARQVAAALGAAHARGIVHRDVKPENVFLVRDRGGPSAPHDFVKVVDFGISTTLTQGRDGEDVGRLTSTGMVLGTPFYMSPEQARGDEELDHRIDVYALGVILYECLTGEVPFRGSNYLAIASRVLNHEPPSPRALRPELRISAAAESVVMRAMAKSRDERYPSMEAFAADIERVLAGEDIDSPSRPPTPTGETAPPAVDERGGRAWLIALALMLLAGGGALLWAGREGAKKPPTAAASTVAVAPVTTPPPPSPAPPMVLLHLETDPPGAEVRQGDRVLGIAPKDQLFPRSEVPAHLTFHLDGYEPGQADVVPLTDDTIRIKLTRRLARPPRTRAATATRTPPPTSSPPSTPSSSAGPSARETLPNPY
jgi:serine/threonine-protein kinase